MAEERFLEFYGKRVRCPEGEMGFYAPSPNPRTIQLNLGGKTINLPLESGIASKVFLEYITITPESLEQEAMGCPEQVFVQLMEGLVKAIQEQKAGKIYRFELLPAPFTKIFSGHQTCPNELTTTINFLHNTQTFLEDVLLALKG